MSEHYVIELRADVKRLVQQLAASEAENERVTEELRSCRLHFDAFLVEFEVVCADLAASQAEARRLREALTEYADPANWVGSAWWPAGRHHEEGVALARAALAETPPAGEGKG